MVRKIKNLEREGCFMVKKRLFKTVASLLATVALFSSFVTLDVSAATLDVPEQNESDYDLIENLWTGSGEVWSEPEYDGWQLTWSVGNFYDRLDRIEKDGIIYLYSYDDNGHRISKSSDGLLIIYKYSSDGYLISEKKEDAVIEYSYVYDEVTGLMKLYGFTYEDAEYVYEYDEAGSIIGIASDGNEVVRYIYDYGVCNQVLGTDENGTWVEKGDDSTFIGNINPFRYTQKYLDSETGWYWTDRYYVQSDGRFLDGISDEKAEQLYELYGDRIEIYCKRYMVGADISQNNVAMMTAADADDEYKIDYIARVLFCESAAYIPDQQAVAWSIKSRMDASYGGKTEAFDTVIYNNEFAGDLAHNDTNGNGKADEGENVRLDFHKEKSGSAWISAYAMANELYKKNNPMSYMPSGYTGQMFFRSVKRMTELLTDDSGTLRLGKDGTAIYSIVIIGFGSIESRGVLESSLVQGYQGKRNVFYKER